MTEASQANQSVNSEPARLIPENDEIILFSSRDLEGMTQLFYELFLSKRGRQDRVASMMASLKQLVRAETACIYESQSHEAGMMLELCRDGWLNWQTAELMKNLRLRKLPELARGPINLEWHQNLVRKVPARRWHCVVSCLPTSTNHIFSLAFARRMQVFSDREALLLRTFHRSPIFELFHQDHKDLNAQIERPLREALTGLRTGSSARASHR
jgi:hypothetical protein